jgi:hypothetical protein
MGVDTPSRGMLLFGAHTCADLLVGSNKGLALVRKWTVPGEAQHNSLERSKAGLL